MATVTHGDGKYSFQPGHRTQVSLSPSVLPYSYVSSQAASLFTTTTNSVDQLTISVLFCLSAVIQLILIPFN